MSSTMSDYFITGHLKQQDVGGALDRVQELYNQFGVRPPIASMLKLLDTSLKKGDEYEARRVVVIINQLFVNHPDLESKSNQLHDVRETIGESLDHDIVRNAFLSSSCLEKRFAIYGLSRDG